MIFEEKQKLNLWWLYVLFGIQAITISSITFLGDNVMSFTELIQANYLPIIVIAFLFLLIYFINQNYLLLNINEDRISYKYWPFSKTKRIDWCSIERAYLRNYDALGEYGGWGFRYRLWFKWNDKAFIFSSDSAGLQIVLTTGKKLLFSTAKKEQLRHFLEMLRQKHQLLMIDTDVR